MGFVFCPIRVINFVDQETELTTTKSAGVDVLQVDKYSCQSNSCFRQPINSNQTTRSMTYI